MQPKQLDAVSTGYGHIVGSKRQELSIGVPLSNAGVYESHEGAAIISLSAVSSLAGTWRQKRQYRQSDTWILVRVCLTSSNE
jgi:hypothetical protein